mgnify:CR=1 FL=1
MEDETEDESNLENSEGDTKSNHSWWETMIMILADNIGLGITA